MKKLSLGVLLLVSAVLISCGGGGGNEPNTEGLTPPSHVKVIK